VLEEKKIQERSILDHFRNHYPDFPKGKVIPGESPDFILKITSRRSIGIELSSLPSSSYNILNRTDFQELVHGIQQTMIKKEEKIRLYRKTKSLEYWLILHVDSLQSGSFNIFNHLERIAQASSFEKVFLFDLFDGKVFML
jgi:hypothetical protein